MGSAVAARAALSCRLQSLLRAQYTRAPPSFWYILHHIEWLLVAQVHGSQFIWPLRLFTHLSISSFIQSSIHLFFLMIIQSSFFPSRLLRETSAYVCRKGWSIYSWGRVACGRRRARRGGLDNRTRKRAATDLDRSGRTGVYRDVLGKSVRLCFGRSMGSL